MRTSLHIKGDEFYFSNMITGRDFPGFDFKRNENDLFGILCNSDGNFLKLWGNSKNMYDRNNMDCTYSNGYHRLMITGVDEI